MPSRQPGRNVGTSQEDAGKVKRGSTGKAKPKKPRGKAIGQVRESVAGLIDPDLAVVIKDPLRVQILALAIQRPISPSEFAKESGCTISASAYHFKVLQNHGFIELVKSVPVRGAVRHLYRATKSGFISNNDWGQVAQAFRPGVAGAVLQDFNNRVTQAMETETLYARDDACLFWAPLKLDETGWKRLTEMIAWAIQEAKEYEVETIKRRDKGEGDDSISVTFAIAGFESPRESDTRKGPGKRSRGKGAAKGESDRKSARGGTQKVRSPLEVVIDNPVRKGLLRELMEGKQLNLTQLATASELPLPAASYHLCVLRDVGAITHSRKRSANEATYVANLDALPAWVRESVETGV